MTGIGGVFFRATNPSAIQEWYAEHLGVEPPPETYDDEPEWQQEVGPAVFAADPGAESVDGADGGRFEFGEHGC